MFGTHLHISVPVGRSPARLPTDHIKKTETAICDPSFCSIDLAGGIDVVGIGASSSQDRHRDGVLLSGAVAAGLAGTPAAAAITPPPIAALTLPMHWTRVSNKVYWNSTPTVTTTTENGRAQRSRRQLKPDRDGRR
jgi:hypothetical protein